LVGTGWEAIIMHIKYKWNWLGFSRLQYVNRCAKSGN